MADQLPDFWSKQPSPVGPPAVPTPEKVKSGGLPDFWSKAGAGGGEAGPPNESNPPHSGNVFTTSVLKYTSGSTATEVVETIPGHTFTKSCISQVAF